MTEYTTPVTGMLRASAVSVATATTPWLGGPAGPLSGYPTVFQAPALRSRRVVGGDRQHGDVLGRLRGDAPLSNQPVPGSLPARRQVLTS